MLPRHKKSKLEKLTDELSKLGVYEIYAQRCIEEFGIPEDCGVYTLKEGEKERALAIAREVKKDAPRETEENPA